ncbi:MAG TPA: protein kinase [Gemmatimonadales bacterium]|nr:protein kinase [Gemmatimonadales bacterium]
MSDPLARLTAALAERYTIEREAGVGGMATVYVARDVKHDRRVALKVLRPELAALLGVERFLSEIRVTAHLQHPHILPLFDSGQAGGLIYYVMPHVEGESLRQRLEREKQLPLETAIEIAHAVASALDYAHRHDVIHRDIKPENILFQDGQAVVADFGIALALTAAGGSRLTETGLSLGTPQYMSPEQATGERTLDARSDVYSLAAILYEMLAGEPPHSGPTVQSVIAKVLTDRPRPLRVLRESVPPSVEFAVQKALAKVPADRFASAAQFAEALTRPGAASEALEGVVTLERQLRASGVAAVPWAFAVLAAGAAVWGWLRPTPRPSVAPVVRFSLAFPTGFQPVDSRGSTVALSPDGSRIVYVGSDSLGGRWLFSRGLERMDPVRIPGTQGAAQPFFSPDGQWIGFWQDGRLRTLSLSGGAVATICEVPSLEGATWGVGGVIAFAASGPLYRVAAAGGKPDVVATPDTARGQAYRWPEFLSDGRALLVTLVDGSGANLAAVSLDGKSVRSLGQTGMTPHYGDRGVVAFGQSDGTLFAAPFDPGRLRFSGAAEPVAEGIRVGQLAVAKFGMSRTGALAYLPGDAAMRELVMVDRAGRSQVLPTPLNRYRAPRFSPDGRRIAVAIEHGTGSVSNSDIWVYELGARSLSRLTFDSINAFPEWMRDGRRVAFVRQLGAITREGLFRIAADGSGVPETLLVRPQPVWEVQFTPDDRTMVFRENHPQTRRDIWVMPLDSPSAAKPLLRTPFEERAMALSSDGHWLAYTSNETGTDEVYVRQLREGSARWRVSAHGGSEPRWGRDARELFFRNGDSVYAAAIQLGAEVRTRPPRALFGGRYQTGFAGHSVSYDVSPDGSRFLLVRDPGTGDQELNVVLNWFDHFRRH